MNKVILAVIIGMICTIFISNYSNSVQADLAHNLVRFHVVANSDSEEDQALKRSVRDRIINEMKEYFDESDNVDATKELIQRNIARIEEIAKDEIKKWNKDYDVKASLGIYPFPTKVYGDITLPAGNYEALRVVIGEGKGANWWCVLFPPLCFVDATHGVVPESSKQKLKNVLTEEEYKIITTANTDDEIPVQIKFKIVEWWQNSKLKVQTAFNRIY
ncbi:MAG: stage sporulation protein [Petroclostridium sp.]|jgi:stage II sporulation protein R|uniref:stage II sporulation protein R n=1 Tax=Petroclostridium xylanilyticum TaxID=1792311 RepID=UPI000B99C466|nr:stage II sporulation protein R [Petroclostridium xylanilyticum]MBZ4645403.1 spoIIR [Clostridia bacterium]MDK2811457.1 stage sporulation protein [Petroclostridium sp.]